MELKQVTRSVKCEIPGCVNKAEYYFEIKKYFVFGNHYFCKKCLGDLYKVLGAKLVPNSIKSLYKKNSEVKEQK